MASPPFSINETLPGDSDVASQFPATERSYRDIVESWLLVNHNNLGQHKVVEIADFGGDPAGQANVMTVWRNGANKLNVRDETGAVLRLIKLAGSAVTKTIFWQATAPLGWTSITTQNDKLIKINSAAGGGSTGSWVISGLTVDGHVLSGAEMPPHDHPVGGRQTRHEGTGSGFSPNETDATGAAQNFGAASAHTHPLTADGNWRPATNDCLLCSLD